MRLLVRCVDRWLVKALRGMMTDEGNTVNRFLWLTMCALFACSSPPASDGGQHSPDMLTPAPSLTLEAQRDAETKSPIVDAPNAVDSEQKRSLSEHTTATFSRLVSMAEQCSALSEIELKRCSHYLKVLAVLGDRSAPLGHRRFLMSSVGNRLLSHRSASVRWLAVRLLKSIAQVEVSSRDRLIERLAQEETPLVIASLMQTVGYFVVQNAELKMMFIRLADHQSPDIRGLAVRHLSLLEDDAELSALLENKLANDPSTAVGEAVCLNLVQRPTDRGLAKVEQIVGNLNHVANEVCFIALTSSWVAPSRAEPSTLGFEMTLTHLNARLSANQAVPWAVIGRVAQGTHLVPKKRLTAQQLEALRATLLKLVDAASQNIQSRVLAVQALKTLQVDRSVFEKIVERYERSDHIDFQLAARARAYLRP
ncbi:MAG: hypothetical protein ACPGQS_01460 [Bradymonadia bacterium]